MKRAVVIVAGGSGTRMNSEIPKQFLLLKGMPILMHTITRFHRFDSNMQLIIVLPKSEADRWERLCDEFHFSIAHQVVEGGSTRFHSVKNGLALVDDNTIVGIHDGVRPLIASSVIERCFTEAANGLSVVPTIPSVDSLRMVTNNGNIALDRSLIRLVQTPQVFPSSLLKSAYEQEYTPTFTDDASVVEAMGYPITLAEGNVENIKITNPLDLAIAERVFESVI